MNKWVKLLIGVGVTAATTALFVAFLNKNKAGQAVQGLADKAVGILPGSSGVAQ